MIKPKDISAFLAAQAPIVDVRSPGEFAQGHMPGAHNIPLFENKERAEVGTLYKQAGPNEAMLRGLEIVGPKLASFVVKASALAPEKKIQVHCWRGGMRSESFAMLLSKAGFQSVGLLKGGYKAFRKEVLQAFSQPLKLVVLGGMTGSGKTLLLHELARQGEQIIDLEGLANHKGSAFGALGEEPQPSTEHFENLTYHQIRQLDTQKRIWVEDESHQVGTARIHQDFFMQMSQAPCVEIKVSPAQRQAHLISDYAGFSKEELAGSILRIKKRLGGLRTTQALEALEAGDAETVISLALAYYDKTYQYGLKLRPENLRHSVDIDLSQLSQSAGLLIQKANELH